MKPQTINPGDLISMGKNYVFPPAQVDGAWIGLNAGDVFLVVSVVVVIDDHVLGIFGTEFTVLLGDRIERFRHYDINANIFDCLNLLKSGESHDLR